MRKLRKRHSWISNSWSGCFTCWGSDAHWTNPKNALAMAARHHDATGHPTWCDQTTTTHYGDSPHDD